MSNATRTLLLSQGYEPIKVISWQRAITLLSLGKVEVVEEYTDEIRTITVVFKIPAVVRLLRAFRRHAKPVKFSRVNIYARDGYRCQYCGVRCGIGELTYDHVVPRAKGGKTTWENIVCSCIKCNSRKANRLPHEAHMRLIRKPVRPKWRPVISLVLGNHNHEKWKDFLDVAYWNVELEE